MNGFGKPGDRPTLLAALREAFRQRIDAAQAGAPATNASAPRRPARPQPPAARTAVSQAARTAPERPAVNTPIPVRERSGPPADRPNREARLVTSLFADPRSLVAAFIVAEVLAKPVALRDP